MKLHDYQIEIAEKIDANYRGENPKRFVGVKLPTGGGKSYIFMDQLEKSIGEFNGDNTSEKEMVSNVSAFYFTPTDGIVSQTKINIVKNIVIDRLIKQYYHGDMHDAVIKIGDRIAKTCAVKKSKNGITFDQKQYNVYMDAIESLYNKHNNTPDLEPEQIILNLFSDFIPEISDKIDLIMQKELPRVKVICYKNIESIDVEQIPEDTSLITFDEGHKVGKFQDEKNEEEEQEELETVTWGQKAEELIRQCPNTRFLSISATPQRDSDGIDPMEIFAVLCGDYTAQELREKAYMASDMTLVEALERGLVVKPEVINVDIMLDQTREYIEMKRMLNIHKNKKKGLNIKDGKPADQYHILIVNFLKMCKLSGKLDFIKQAIIDNDKYDKSIASSLDIFIEGKEDDFLDINNIVNYYNNLEKVLDIVDEIDNPNTEIHVKYEEYRTEQIQKIVAKTKAEYPYIDHGKHICFTPATTASKSSKNIMEGHKKKIAEMFGVSPIDILITHGNKAVISKKLSDQNLEKFMMAPAKLEEALFMIAMNIFNEGLHVDGVTALEMFRQIGESDQSDKEDPTTLFLQQIGRCIHSIKKGEVVTEPPVIFDFACNFMRFNEKLNGLFKISESQREFKELFDESVAVSKGKAKDQDQNEIEDIPKPKILGRILGMMEALAKCGIDISNITKETTWGDLSKNLPEDEKENVLNWIYVESGMRITDDYQVGLKIISARNAFWHRESTNNVQQGKKLLYNAATDKFFEQVSFDLLYSVGFFKDLENERDTSRVDDSGFIIGNCASLDSFHGFNIQTGTRYSKGYPQFGIPGIDVNKFTKSGIHFDTGLRYNTRFFKFDDKTKTWINLHTGKDEDLLGYNHDGIRVNSKMGRIRFW